MLDLLLLSVFFWIIVPIFVTNKATYSNYTQLPVGFLSMFPVIVFCFGYKMYQLINSSLITNDTPFNDLRGFEELIPPMRHGLFASIDVFTPGFNAFLISGVLTATVFVALVGNKPQPITITALYTIMLILVAGFTVISTSSIALLFVFFELLLLASLYLLRLTSKSERVIEASIEMFFWTLVGSLALLIAFTWLLVSGVTCFTDLVTNAPINSVVYMLLIVGFGVKIPVWPFFSWLLKAHVEASVEFSILLSGFIVKAGVWAFYRLIQHTNSHLTMLSFASLCLVGILISSLRLLTQRDLKRIVALTTVIEMNWVGFCLALGNDIFDQIAVYLVAAHSVITALEFLIVESIAKRYNSRDVTQVFGLAYRAPLLTVVAFYTTLITIGFPGTPLFFAKLIFFSSALYVNSFFIILLLIILLLLIPLTFIRIWTPIWFGLKATQDSLTINDLTILEMVLFGTLTFISILFSFCPTLLILI